MPPTISSLMLLEVWVPGEMSAESDLITAGFNYYFGPVHFNTLKAYDKGVSDSSQSLKLEDRLPWLPLAEW